MLDKILLQIPVGAPDTVAANKIQEATNAVTSRVDSLATKLNADSIAAMTPGKLVDKFKEWGDGKIRWKKMFKKIK